MGDTRMTTIPAALDILPPRPVLFPWLPSSMECFLDLGLGSCCFGAEEIDPKDDDPSPKYEAPALKSVLSFDDDDDDDDEFCDAIETEKTISSAPKPPSQAGGSRFSLKPLFGHEKTAAGQGTTTILVLSRDDDDDEIPDMSDVLSEAGSESSSRDDESPRNYRKNTKPFYSPPPGVKLVSLADVVEQILRVLVFIISATSMKPKMLRSGNYQAQPVQSQ